MEAYGNWPKFNSRYYAPYSHLSEDVLREAICDQAREELIFARDQLRKYRHHVNRQTVSGNDEVEYKGGHMWVNSGLWALHAVCDRFGRGVEPMYRLARVLQRHAERLDRQIDALYERDKARVQEAREAERAVKGY